MCALCGRFRKSARAGLPLTLPPGTAFDHVEPVCAPDSVLTEPPPGVKSHLANENMNYSSLENDHKLDNDDLKSEPWIVVDPFFKREWLIPQGVRYYIVEDKTTGKSLILA